MSLDSSELFVAGRGAMYRCPLGTAQPAAPDAVLDPECLHLGYFSTDGLEMPHDDSTNDIFGWQGSTLLRTIITESKVSASFTPLQTRGSVLETYYPGSEVTEVGSEHFELRVRPRIALPYTWIFDIFDGTRHIRYWFPRAEVTERGSLMFLNSEPIGYPMTVTFYPVPDPTDPTQQVIFVEMTTELAFAEGVVVTS